jgi:hypothetical protein
MEDRIQAERRVVAGWRVAIAACRAFVAKPKVRCAVPWVLALGPAFALAVPIVREVPFSRDHATHMFKVWHFWEELVPSGRLRGWSHFWGFGFPSDEMVPCGGEVWVGLFRGLTLGLLDWARTYAVAFGALMVLKTTAAFVFTRHYFGAAAAVLAAWFTLLDPGALLEGGWDWHTHWGVWPVTLSVSLCLLGMTRLDRVLVARRARDVAWCGAWFGAALLTHQLALVVFAISAPLMFVDHALRRRAFRAESYVLALGALSFGVALAAFFLLPFLARSAATFDLGWMHDRLSVVSQKVVEFQTFKGVWPPIQALGMLGVWLVARSRRRGSFLFPAAALLLVLLASDLIHGHLQLERAMPTLIKLEVSRLLLVAKLFWFPLAGVALVWLSGAPRRLSAFRRPIRRVVAEGSLAVLALLLVAPGWKAIYERQLHKPIIGQQDVEYWADFQPFLEWSRELKKRTPEHYRIAYRMEDLHNHLSTVMPMYNETPMYKVGYTPTQLFDKVPRADGDELYEAMSVKYVVSTTRIRSRTLDLRRRFGRLWVYEFNRYRPQPFSVLGAGRAELVEFAPERIRVNLDGTAPGSRLKIHVANFDRWQASIDGELLPITTATVYGPHYPLLIEVPARDGELVLEYVYRSSDWLGLLLSWCALPAFFGFWWWGRGSPRVKAATRWLEQRKRWLGFGGVGVVVVTVAIVANRTRTRERLLPAESIFHRVAAEQMFLGDVACEPIAPLTFACGGQLVMATKVVSSAWGMHLCMNAPATAPLRVQVPVEFGSFVALQYNPPREGAGAIQVNLDGQLQERLATRPAAWQRQFLQYDTRHLRGISGTLGLEFLGAAQSCFDVRLVE